MSTLVAAALAGCQSTTGGGSSVLDSAVGPAIGGMFVPLGGSALGGSVTFQQRAEAMTMVAHVTGASSGVYRVAVHATGNCSSPNGFSAGAPWAPPGRAPLVYTMATNSEGTATLSVRIPGLSADGPSGLRGRSVVVHEGAVGPLDAQPGVRNGRIACAAIGDAPSLGIKF
jgi:Cu-Zn family superoxide dismutase